MSRPESPPAIDPDRLPAGRAWLSPEECAALVEVNPTRVRKWMARGVTVADPRTGVRSRVALRGFKVGARWRVRPADLEAFVRVTTEASAHPAAVAAPDAGRQKEARRRAAADRAAAFAALGLDDE